MWKTDYGGGRGDKNWPKSDRSRTFTQNQYKFMIFHEQFYHLLLQGGIKLEFIDSPRVFAHYHLDLNGMCTKWILFSFNFIMSVSNLL